MRLVVSLLMVALGSSLALADAPAPPPAPAAAPAPTSTPIPLRVVRVMPESHQALLFDRTRGTHVLAEVGQQIDGYLVETIADDTVTLRATGAGPQVVLAAPDRSWRHHDTTTPTPSAPAPADPYAPTTVSPTPSAPGPADPYATTPAGPAPAGPAAPAPGDPYAAATVAPSDPYADTSSSTPVRVVEAPVLSQPITAGEGGMRTIDAATPAGPAATVSPVSPTAIAAPPAPSPALPPAPATQLAPSDEAEPELVLTHAQLDTELADFNSLAASITATFAPGGVRVDTVATGSLFARAGLRAGDIISAVNGQPLRSLDDAAELYATASSARNISITIVRAGKPTALHVTIK